jgi:methylenetetrahydrofolate--tRNA-(uracil-5-)-methyltransferase
MNINVIGAGLAGSEAAFQLAEMGYSVKLYEMRPVKTTPAHHTANFAELVCSNSLKGMEPKTGAGLLKKELELMDSMLIKTAYEHSVSAGGALAVDRDAFSEAVTRIVSNHPNIEVVYEEVTEIPEGPTIVCSGPLTSEGLSEAIMKLLGEDYLYFYDAAAPIVTKESINMDIAYLKSRYDKGEADYINCPMTAEEFDVWYEEVINAKTSDIKDFELKLYEGCMPFEEMARRGKQTLLYGPLKPVGLWRSDEDRSKAVVQLRQDNANASLYNIVGMQTNIKWGDQKRIIQMIPGLENAEIVRYGVMHRNTFINSVKYLNKNLQFKARKDLFFAGQITGLEGYNCAIMSGLVAAKNLDHYLKGEDFTEYPLETMTGALLHYITTTDEKHFQPMGPNFGLLPQLSYRHKKKQRKELYGKRALEVFKTIKL